MKYLVYGGRQPPTPEALAHGLAGVWMAAVIGPTNGPLSESYDLASAYGPIRTAGLGPLPLLAVFDYLPTPTEVDAMEQEG